MIRWILLVSLATLVSQGESKLPGVVVPLLQMAWDQINPYSINNKIKDISSQLKYVKTKLEKIEHTVIFGKYIKTIEYLIEKYNDGTENEKEILANTALSYGSDGFDKSLSSLEEMMDGTSNIFAEGSIFQVIANDEDGDVCTNIDGAWKYLTGLWTVGHAVWAQTYKIKHKTGYTTFTANLKNTAESSLSKFEEVKDLVYPDYCHCFEKGVYYAEMDFLTGKKMPTEAISAMNCQTLCQQDSDCKAFTFIQSQQKCYKHTHDENESEVHEDTQSFEVDDIVSGPKVCSKHFSFCCSLGYGVSVFIVVIIVIVSCWFCCFLCTCAISMCVN